MQKVESNLNVMQVYLQVSVSAGVFVCVFNTYKRYSSIKTLYLIRSITQQGNAQENDKQEIFQLIHTARNLMFSYTDYRIQKFLDQNPVIKFIVKLKLSKRC